MAYNNRGYNRQLLAAYKEALADFDKAIQLAPEYGLAYQNKAWLLATCADDKMRNGKQAVTAATKACELREWKMPSDWKALAAAYAETGDFANALKWQRKVVDAEEGEAKQLEQTILALYEKQEPYRAGTER
jgi:tetratricopeptide (TPR) repeat protein